MTTPNDSSSSPDISWCPGCGNFAILEAVKQALGTAHRTLAGRVRLRHRPGREAAAVICPATSSMHGVALVTATGVKLANHKLIVIADAGDGDIYSEGANHLMHALRKNVNITCLVHNNQVFGLTKGQFSRPARAGFQSGTSPQGSLNHLFNPLAFAVALEAGFVARGFAGDIPGSRNSSWPRCGTRGFQPARHPAALRDLQQGEHVQVVPVSGLQSERRARATTPSDKTQAFARSLEWSS